MEFLQSWPPTSRQATRLFLLREVGRDSSFFMDRWGCSVIKGICMLRQIKSAVKQRLTQEDWDRVKLRFRKFLRSIGYDPTHWIRVVQLQDWMGYLDKLSVERLDVLEISPGFESDWQKIGFRSYKAVHFPEFDVTRDVLPQKFDVIIADQVFEHVRDPYMAAPQCPQDADR